MIYDLTKFREEKLPVMYIYTGHMLDLKYDPDPKDLLVRIPLTLKDGTLVRTCSGEAEANGEATWFRVYNLFPDVDMPLQGTVGEYDEDLILLDN